jgi:D-amino-acid dehydrogenase
VHVIIVGAGLVGVSTAWSLLEDGHRVTVIERQPGAARETSLANGGQISTSHAEPWANPAVFGKLLRWLGREDAPLLWRLRADARQWAWGLRFLAQCTPGRSRRNLLAILRLALYSRSLLKELRPALALAYDEQEKGILHFYTDAREFAHALPQAELMREFGCDRVPKSAAECLAIEPALAASTVPIIGGTYTADDESGDAHLFACRLAEAATQRGAEFRYECNVAGIEVVGGEVAALHLAGGERLVGDAYVIAAGSYAVPLLAPLGISLPIYPAKGYSATIALAAGDPAPVVSLTDDGCKIVFSRLGERLRVAGTAEFNGFDTTLPTQRCVPLMERSRALFPWLAGDRAVEYWTGLRPATPGNVPLIGPTRIGRLYVNGGHGTLGWTMACGTGRLLADLIGGRRPDIDPAPYAISG